MLGHNDGAWKLLAQGKPRTVFCDRQAGSEGLWACTLSGKLACECCSAGIRLSG